MSVTAERFLNSLHYKKSPVGNRLPTSWPRMPCSLGNVRELHKPGSDPSWLHIYLVPAALLGTRALHQNARACPGAGPYVLTIIRIINPDSIDCTAVVCE